MRKVLIVVAFLVALVVAGVLGLRAAYDEPRPRGAEGPAAEALAQRMMAAADVAAWQRTGAVRWTFRGRNHLLWDRRRNLVQVRWGEDRALLRIDDRTGLAYHAGLRVHGAMERSFLGKAYRFWANDSFWLNPIAKLYDPGVTRGVVKLEDGGEGLLVSYSQGGVTPGDAYLWVLGPDGLPVEWRMWVKVLPVGGARASWGGWQTLATGAKVATEHEIGPVGVRVSDIEAAETLEALLAGEPDPFAPLFAK